MGQFLLWVELGITSLLLMAVGQSICTRLKRKWVGFVLGLVWGLLMLIPWAGVIVFFTHLWAKYQVIMAWPLKSVLMAGSGVLLGSILLGVMAWQHATQPRGPEGKHWRPGRLAIYGLVMLLVAGWNFWLLDQAVQLKIAQLRISAIALATAAAPPPADPRDNAAPLFRQAVEMMEAIPSIGPATDMRSAMTQAIDDIDFSSGKFDPTDPRLIYFLKEAAPAIQLLQHAASKSRCDFGPIYNPPSIEILLPYLNDARAMALVLCASARMHGNNGEMDQALADLRAAEGLGRLISDSPLIVSVLVGIGLEALTFENYQALMENSPFPTHPSKGDWEERSFCMRLQLPRAIQYEMAFHQQYAGSVQWALWQSQSLRTLPWSDQALFKMPAVYRVFMAEGDIQATQLYSQRVLSRSAWLQPPTLDRWPDQIGKLTDGAIGPYGAFNLPILRSVMVQAAKADAISGLMILSRGMIRYRAASGKYPEHLNDLVPTYLPAMPMDPFSGQPMKMIDKDGQRILYSISNNFTDDQGEKPSKANQYNGDIALTLPK